MNAPLPDWSRLEDLPALAQAAALFVLTFLSEDAATFGAGWLVKTQTLSGPAGFWGCALGIWAGDALLYGVARVGGQVWLNHPGRARHRAAVQRAVRWFERWGFWLLLLSRFLPGARVPTYLAAGLLRQSAMVFLSVTGVAAVVWTALVFLLTQTVASAVTPRWSAGSSVGWAVPTALLMVWCARRWRRARAGRSVVPSADPGDCRPPATESGWRRLAEWTWRWTRWEFWPAWAFYPPVALYCSWLGFRFRGLTLPTAANPGMFSGGIIGESKSAILADLMATSPEFTAEAELVSGGEPEERLASLQEIVRRRGWSYPIILKPDVGQRGVGVKRIDHADQARAVLLGTSAPWVAQRFVPGPHEAGIFYYRFPHEPRGRIFSITEKVFPFVEGDGRSTLGELLGRQERSRFLGTLYRRRFAERLGEVLPCGARLKLVEAGNHAQGCIFRDGLHLATPALAGRIERIARGLPGFYIGRFDVRYASVEDLQAGRNFAILELNGAASEATSLYDARHTLRQAYRMLFQQWRLVYALGAANRRRGVAPTPLLDLWRAWRQHLRQAAHYPMAD